MMKKITILLPILLMLSCTVQKRHYQKGYFVSWTKNTSSKEAPKENRLRTSANKIAVKTETAPVYRPTQLALNANSSKELELQSIKKNKIHLAGPEDSCDVIIFRDGSELKAKILEVSNTQVKYRKCAMSDGPVYITEKAKIFMVKYINGSNEVFKAPAEPIINSSPQNLPNRTQPYKKKRTGLATTGLVFAILGFYPVIFVGGIVAIITSLIQLNNISNYPDDYGAEKKARVALIMGIISIILWIFIIALIVLSA